MDDNFNNAKIAIIVIMVMIVSSIAIIAMNVLSGYALSIVLFMLVAAMFSSGFLL